MARTMRRDQVSFQRITVLFPCVVYSFVACILSAAPPIADDEARPHLDWTDAAEVVGRTSYVSGRIVRVGHARTIHFLNFHPERRDVFKVVIFDDYMKNFLDSLEELYEGKNVRVRGIVSTFGGSPQIQVTHPGQIEVLDELPKTSFEKPKAPAAGEPLALATFNIRNLFDDDDSPYHNDGSTRPKPREELEDLAKMIHELNADILALQEVESRGYLERFLEVFCSDLGYQHVVHFEGNDLRGIDVALLSRIPVGAVTSHRHLRFPGSDDSIQRFRRDLLTVELMPEGADPFEVWVVHLKSNSDGRPRAEPIRLAECRKIRELLDQRLHEEPSAKIVICGDFNDTETSDTVKTIAGTGEYALSSAWEEVPKDQRISYNMEPYRTLIDFIYWSPAMRDHYVPGTYRVLHEGMIDTIGSDHNPVVARFNMGKASVAKATK